MLRKEGLLLFIVNVGNILQLLRQIHRLIHHHAHSHLPLVLIIKFISEKVLVHDGGDHLTLHLHQIHLLLS